MRLPRDSVVGDPDPLRQAALEALPVVLPDEAIDPPDFERLLGKDIAWVVAVDVLRSRPVQVNFPVIDVSGRQIEHLERHRSPPDLPSYQRTAGKGPPTAAPSSRLSGALR